MTAKTKKTSKENMLEIGWCGEIGDYLSNLVPNGIVKIENENSLKRFGLKVKKNYIQEMMRQLSEMMKLQREYDLKLVLKNKISPLQASEFASKHPIVVHRLNAEKLIEFNKKKPKKHYSRSYIKKIEEIQCKNIKSEVEKMGIKFRELKFGESYVFDYYKHGRHLKEKMNEHNKAIGLHLPRSDLQVKINDEKLNRMTKININNVEDLKIFHEMANKLIKEPYTGRY